MGSRDDTNGLQSELEGDERIFQVAARNLIGSFFVLLRVALVHEMENRAVGPALTRFRMNLEDFHRKCAELAALQFVGDAVFVNRRLVRADYETFEKARFVREFFGRLGIGEVSFEAEVSEQSVKDFVSAARHAVLEPGGVAAFRESAFPESAFPGIAVRDLDAHGVECSEEAVVLPDPVQVVRAFGIVVVTVRQFLAELERGESPPTLPLRRAVQEFVRLPAHTHSLQLGVLALDQFRNELAGRQARVAVIVVMMGKRLELGVADLREMGVAAILAGAGRVLSKDLAFAPVERCAAEDLFREAARRFATVGGQSGPALLRLIVASELGRVRDWSVSHPVSRMLAVAEAFEQLTTKPPAGAGLQPVEAQQRILSSREYDQASARLLVSTLGLFPVGSMVKLSTGETAIIVEGPQSAEQAALPQVMLVTDTRGHPVKKRIIDLAETGTTILGTVDATKLDLNMGHFLFT